MSEQVQDQDEEIEYGNLESTKLPGLGRLGAVGSGVLLTGAVVLLLLLIISLKWAVIWTVFIGLLLLPAALPLKEGENRYGRVVQRWSMRRGRARGETELRAGVVGHVPDGACRVPGLGVQSRLTSHRDVHGREFGMVSYPDADLHTVSIQCYCAGFAGVDKVEIDGNLAQWAAWMGDLNKVGEIVGASATIEAAPDTGQRLRRTARRGRVEDAPKFSRELVDELIRDQSGRSPATTVVVAVTFSGRLDEEEAEVSSRKRSQSIEEMGELIGDLLPVLTSTMGATGAGTGSRPRTAQEITDETRMAYDPGVAELIEDAASRPGGTGLQWKEAGPISASARFDHYITEDARHRTWQMWDVPPVMIRTTLRKLLAPNKDVPRKRVTLLYRPESEGRSSELAEQGVKKARFIASQSKYGTALGDQRMHAARKTAQQAAKGSPLMRVGLMVSVTAMSKRDLLRASRATVRNLAPAARLRLRVVRAAQDTAFLATLPLGVVLPEMLTRPKAKDADPESAS